MDLSTKDALTVLAYIYLEHFKYDKALYILKALNRIHPDDPYVLRTLAYAHLKTGDHGSALRCAEASLKPGITKEEEVASQLIKGKALWGLGKEEAARHTLKILETVKLKEINAREPEKPPAEEPLMNPEDEEEE